MGGPIARWEYGGGGSFSGKVDLFILVVTLLSTCPIGLLGNPKKKKVGIIKYNCY